MTQNKIHEPALQNIKKTGDSYKEIEEKICHILNTFLPASCTNAQNTRPNNNYPYTYSWIFCTDDCLNVCVAW
jgi:hypothetical protein